MVGTIFRDYPPFDDAPEDYDADKAWAQAILCVVGATVVFAACAVVSEVAAAKLKHGELRPSDIRKIAVKSSFKAVIAAAEVMSIGKTGQRVINMGCGFTETKLTEGEAFWIYSVS